ncbi:MAG: hypothetical protein JST59_29405 [Actinobacteria bacterium]|nr:hypothetical protein [Actinomycetota bacterium]
MTDAPGEWDMIEEATRDIVRSWEETQPTPTRDTPAASVLRSEFRRHRARGCSEDDIVAIVGAEVLRSVGDP